VVSRLRSIGWDAPVYGSVSHFLSCIVVANTRVDQSPIVLVTGNCQHPFGCRPLAGITVVVLFHSRGFRMKISKMLAASMFSVAACVSVNLAHAQDSGTAQPTTKKATRSANWKLEHAVRHELDKEKLDTSDIRIVARAGVVSLDGTVKDESQIAAVGTAAEGVAGVKSVKNDVTVRVVGQ
jgi:hyperosmotically inducible protein